MNEATGSNALKGTLMVRLVDAVWEGVVIGDSKWNPDRTCYDLADEYRRSGRTVDECVQNFIKWQTAKAGGAGFVLGLPGLAFGIVTIPADLTFTTYLQLRMVAVIALLHGWDAKSDRLKTLALLSMLGTGAAEAVRAAGVQVGAKMTAAALKKVPGRVLIEINKAVGFRLVTKAGTKGVVNLVKFVPIAGGLVSGSLNALATRTIGYTAHGVLKAGPGIAWDEIADPDRRRAPPFPGPARPTVGAAPATHAYYPLPAYQSGPSLAV